MRKWLGLATLALLLAGGATAWLGDLDPDVNLSSASEVWGDVLRDADQFGLRLTRMSDAREVDLGNRLIAGMNLTDPPDPAQEAYIAAVGSALVPYLRRPGIRYSFHVLPSSQENAFALPGGQVFIFTGMLADIHSEAELAYILGHEMSHVDLRHAVELYQNESVLDEAVAPGIARIPEHVRRFVARGYSKYQETEADAQSLRLCSQAGYDPEAAPRLYRRFRPGSPRAAAANPLDEIAGATHDQLASYFDTHPPDAERIRTLEELAKRNRERLAGRALNEGVENYERQVPVTR